jgi:hypothetical protein
MSHVADWTAGANNETARRIEVGFIFGRRKLNKELTRIISEKGSLRTSK